MSTEWKSFMRRHWEAGALFALGVILAFAGAFYVLLWYVANAQSSGMVPSTLGLWTMNNLVTFVVYAVLWELLFVGVAAAVGVLLVWQWWKRLPEGEWKGLKFTGRKRSTGGGGGSLLFFIAFCLKVYYDGKWNVPLATFTLDYVVGSIVLILVWGMSIFAIGAGLALAWWLNRGAKH